VSPTVAAARPQFSYVRLGPDPPGRFESAIKKDAAVFFDECNRQVSGRRAARPLSLADHGRRAQIFVVKEGEYDTVVDVTSLKRDMCMHLRVTNRGPIQSIKLSPNQSILGLQCAQRTIVFINLATRTEVSFTPSRKKATYLGFNWIGE